ncbi:MAG: tRNA (adenosine(37)-N6)-threonylcarbamoyltransferase complex transferase subunit TsaD [Pseudomonadota bacterium]
MLILGIESSCDETGAAIVRNGKTILSSLVSSQIDIHRRYGGVVPELASRRHVEVIYSIVEDAFSEAGIDPEEIDGTAVTNGPGLVGALLIGVSFAKGFSYARNLPLVGVSHIEGHIFSIFLQENPPEFPYIGLLASGGHTALYYVSDYTMYRVLGKTRDDAAGEAFDKAAKMLGLAYPGGVIIGKLAEAGDRHKIRFPRALAGNADPDRFDFSFSGLKTALANYIRSEAGAGRSLSLEDVSASFQEAIVDVLVEKTIKAALNHDVKNIVAVGGVASNRRLRTALDAAARKAGMLFFTPDPSLCTDNAAMIAAAGYHHFRKGESSGLDLDVYSRSASV